MKCDKKICSFRTKSRKENGGKEGDGEGVSSEENAPVPASSATKCSSGLVTPPSPIPPFVFKGSIQ